MLRPPGLPVFLIDPSASGARTARPRRCAATFAPPARPASVTLVGCTKPCVVAGAVKRASLLLPRESGAQPRTGERRPPIAGRRHGLTFADGRFGAVRHADGKRQQHRRTRREFRHDVSPLMSRLGHWADSPNGAD